ncbi:MAG: serine/threonine-protein kinase [Gordonia sp. (in: high G+C Gram-positive bacteria)]|uniref:serine/threonine-protein kinase n=1 Tax=Gordonia sp. (in: high G+C Gram-positive bacteria) TaxID=84139 RepID=UPI0039E49F34
MRFIGVDQEDGRLLKTGDEIGGYAIERVLGTGGMGVVYLAHHPRIPRRVALKVISAEAAATPAYRARFDREAATVAALKHPNIIDVLDVGEDDAGDGVVLPWLSMSYIEGMDLADLLHKTRGPMAPEEVLRIARGLAAGLDYAHARGVIHRDIKPGNVLLEQGTGGVYLADFGIARSAHSPSDLTGADVALGTAEYVSPEQLCGLEVTSATDRYALGCLLFRMLTGTVPFPGETTAVKIGAHLHTPPPAASSVNPTLPPDVDALLIRAMAKKPAQRPATARELVAVLGRALACGPTAAVARSRDTASRSVAAESGATSRTSARSSSPGRISLVRKGAETSESSVQAGPAHAAASSTSSPVQVDGRVEVGDGVDPAGAAEGRPLTASEEMDTRRDSGGSGGSGRSKRVLAVIAGVVVVLVGGLGALGHLVLGGGSGDDGCASTTEISDEVIRLIVERSSSNAAETAARLRERTSPQLYERVSEAHRMMGESRTRVTNLDSTVEECTAGGATVRSAVTVETMVGDVAHPSAAAVWFDLERTPAGWIVNEVGDSYPVVSHVRTSMSSGAPAHHAARTAPGFRRRPRTGRGGHRRAGLDHGPARPRLGAARPVHRALTSAVARHRPTRACLPHEPIFRHGRPSA